MHLPTSKCSFVYAERGADSIAQGCTDFILDEHHALGADVPNSSWTSNICPGEAHSVALNSSIHPGMDRVHPAHQRYILGYNFAGK